ncbi:MAG: J domain-containing protein [Chloroflexota bacterium]|nr:J domain-containing protein [Chloroflexota bacterium]
MLSGDMLVRILLLLAIILLTGWFFVLWRTVRVRGPQPARAARRSGRSADTFSQHSASPRVDRARPDTSGPATPRESPKAHGSAAVDRPFRPRAAWEGGGPQWNPYAAEQSRAERAQAARRQPRPSRPALQHESATHPAGPSIYDTLGVSSHADVDQIEQAYRRHVARIHPDKFYDDPVRHLLAQEELKRLNAAMQVLRDPPRRALYDARRQCD